MAFFKKKKESEVDNNETTKKVEKKSSGKKVVSKTPKVKKTKKDSKDVPSKKPIKVTSADLSWVLLSPRVTEKAAIQSENKVYIFNVHKDANKQQIKGAIEKKFEVTPIKINIAKISAKPVFRKGIRGKKPEGKKAFVYLSKKDNIQFV